MSAEEALEYAKKVTGEACAAICKYDNSELLIGFAEMLLKRKN